MKRGRVPLAPDTKRARLLGLLPVGTSIHIDLILLQINTSRAMIPKMIDVLRNYGYDIKLVSRNTWLRIN